MITEENSFKIPIRVENYEELFNQLDFREIEKREFNQEINDFIDRSILRSSIKIKDMELELVIYIPLKEKNEEVEEKCKEGIFNYYKSYFNFKKKINRMGMKRIIYYAFCSFVLFNGWHFLNDYKRYSFISAILNAGGTVLLWEIMSLALIERKNISDKGIIKNKLLNMKILFKYIDL